MSVGRHVVLTGCMQTTGGAELRDILGAEYSPLPPFPARGSGERCKLPQSGAKPQSKSNLVHFSLKIWHLAATDFMIFLRRNWSNMWIIEVADTLLLKNQKSFLNYTLAHFQNNKWMCFILLLCCELCIV